MKRILLAITGASGAIYGIRLLQALRASGLAEVHLILSEAACWTVPHETGLSAAEVETFADHSYRWNEIWQLPASGSYPMDSMVIAPCSMKTLAAIRIGLGDTLITRSADVAAWYRVWRSRFRPVHKSRRIYRTCVFPRRSR